MNEFSNAPLLVELGCEELPPKALDTLAESFFESVCSGLQKARVDFDRENSRWYATPRRLAFVLASVAARQPDQSIQRRGPAVQAAFAEDGSAKAAANGFARSVGVTVDDLQRKTEDGKEYLYFESMAVGKELTEILYPLLEQAAKQLPVPKPMRWSSHDFQFVRPVHWLVVMHGDTVLEGSLFSRPAGRQSMGHRVHAPGPHEITTASDYESTLESAFVMADPARRREKIAAAAVESGQKHSAFTSIDEDLLEEVKNLVEWPVCLSGEFEQEFLDVPAEALVSSMQSHQKFFPVYTDDSKQQLINRFVTVANLESSDPEAVIEGFERVIRPRLSDARFFWDQDRKQPLFDYRDALDGIIFQKQLGTIGDKCNRVAALCGKIAEFMQTPAGPVCQAAQLAKCDLVSQMVGEFPDLQGVMGRYYAIASGEDEAVARAIEEHYLPRFAGDTLPGSETGLILALADRLDTLIGIFAINQKPTGNKDPFALRRAALGCVRLLQQGDQDLSLDDLLAAAAAGYGEDIDAGEEIQAEVKRFILDRLRNLCREQGYSVEQFNAVVEIQDNKLQDFSARLAALKQFATLPEAASLAAANKRISNILRKSAASESFQISDINAQLDEERTLLIEVNEITDSVRALSAAGDYTAALNQLAGLRPAVDAFFEQVMVMDEDPGVRRSRLALVSEVRSLFQNVANISALAQ
jgi:glycyl-tRNA synthetase beta chain